MGDLTTGDSPAVILRRGRDASVRGRHPWLFSGSIAESRGEPRDGDEVAVVDGRGEFLAWGLYNGRSQIRVRVYSWSRDERLTSAFWESRLDAALRLRESLEPYAAAQRLVFSEGDGLSGLVVDRYGSWLVLQLTSLALHERLHLLLDLLEDRVRPEGIYLRTERGAGEEEGIEVRDGLLRGSEPDRALEVREGDVRFRVDLRTGQKTGFYLDQRDNRRRAGTFASGRRIADLCCYSGGFGLHMARAGAAHVTGVDVSAAALELARENASLNGVAPVMDFERADAFRWLEEAVAAGRTFGAIVLDPPRFARSRRGVPQALRAYRSLNALAMRCLDPDGLLVTCSCSGRVSREAFLQVVGEAGVEAGRFVQLLESRGQGADHPVALTCPETAYLKCLLCRVV